MSAPILCRNSVFCKYGSISDGRRHLSFSSTDMKDVIGNLGGWNAYKNAPTRAPTNAPTNAPTMSKGGSDVFAPAKKTTKNM